MFETKRFTQSLTIKGAIVAIAGVVLPPLLAKIGVTPEDAKTAVDLLGDAITLAGSVLAIVGRVRATHQIA